MLFSSLIFLYLFLPLTLLGYYLSPAGIKNYWLLFTSLIFFAWGGVSMTLLLLVSIVLNYFFGLRIDAAKPTGASRWWLIAGVTVNVGLLCFYKYADFFVKNLNKILEGAGLGEITQPEVSLPIGISFYTFHALSYLTDIYRGKTSAQKNIFNLALYITMFSQLIAGPIIRYSDVWQQLTRRTHTMSRFVSGIERFLIGLFKKVLLANTFARVADPVFDDHILDMSAPLAWLGLLCYTLQIYYDFAGYSDMAIGLGRMFGFEFMENFNFPYLAGSVKDFWRRWHISLSGFFRDYVYIPLGGNRLGPFRTYVNLLTVFFLTGLWHGASWNFVVWGLFHGLFMLAERAGMERLLEGLWRPVQTIYTVVVVMFAWAMFRVESIGNGILYWKDLLNLNTTPLQFADFMKFVTPELLVCLLIGIFGALGGFMKFKTWHEKLSNEGSGATTLPQAIYQLLTVVLFMGLFYLCTNYLLAGGYNPFIYYRF